MCLICMINKIQLFICKFITYIFFVSSYIVTGWKKIKKNSIHKMDRLANVVATDLYNSEEGDLCLIDEPIVKRKGRPRKLLNFVEDSDLMKIPKMLMNSAKENYWYRQLVQSMKFLQIDKKELAQQFIDAYCNPESINATTTSQAKYLKSLEHYWLWCRGIDLKQKQILFYTPSTTTNEFQFENNIFVNDNKIWA